MESLTCKNCRRTSSVPPSAQRIRCFGCNTVYSICGGSSSSSNGSSNTLSYKGSSPEWGVDFANTKLEAKLICRSLRRKLPCISSAQTAGAAPPIPTWDQPQRGRRALICGVSYRKTKHELKGTAQDVKNMHDLLVQDYNFPKKSIRVLAEEEGFPYPTRKNIEEGLQWLMRGIHSGDSLVFYFSGHGKRQREFEGDEVDGFNETICPLDFETNGMIVDNYINETIVRPLIQDVTLHAIIDSCHSGTILDLPRVYDINTRKWEDNSPPSGAYKGTKGGKAICFSACEDYQLAADTSVLSSKKEMTGAMTITFINAIKDSVAKKKNITYHEIMASMHTSINQAHKSGGFFSGVRRFFHRRILQKKKTRKQRKEKTWQARECAAAGVGWCL